jgi:hypothetical protein
MLLLLLLAAAEGLPPALRVGIIEVVVRPINLAFAQS